MEKLGHPQTHLGLKAMIKEVLKINFWPCHTIKIIFLYFQVDEDLDNKISYKEFLLIFRYAKSGQLKSEGLKAIAGSVNVDEVGVGGAKSFFETKAKVIADNPAERDRAYHEQRKAEAQQKAANKAAFKERAAAFK